MSQPIVTSKVLDTSTGRPAAQLFTELYECQDEEDSWKKLSEANSTDEGMIRFKHPSNMGAGAGVYKLKFRVKDYYGIHEKKTLFKNVEIVFTVKEGEHYHLPLLLSPYGYSTYKGKLEAAHRL